MDQPVVPVPIVPMVHTSRKLDEEDVLAQYDAADALADTHELAISALSAEYQAQAIVDAATAAETAAEIRRQELERKRVDLDELLIHLLDVGGSDLHLTVGAPPDRPQERRDGAHRGPAGAHAGPAS